MRILCVFIEGDTITGIGINVIRLAGKDRYETSLKVAQEIGTSTKVVIITGDSFPVKEIIMEKDVNLAVALKLGALLQSQGIKVVYTRVDDNVSWTNNIMNDLQTRCDIANKIKADFVISIHSNSANSSLAKGSETYYSIKKPSDSTLAKVMEHNLVAANKLIDRGVKDANFYVLNNTIMPSVLAELAFISNPNEEKFLNNFDFQAKSANGLANGILEILNR